MSSHSAGDTPAPTDSAANDPASQPALSDSQGIAPMMSNPSSAPQPSASIADPVSGAQDEDGPSSEAPRQRSGSLSGARPASRSPSRSRPTTPSGGRRRSSFGTGSRGSSPARGASPSSGGGRRFMGHRADLGWEGGRRASFSGLFTQSPGQSSPMDIAPLAEGQQETGAVVWGTTVQREKVEEDFEKFLRNFRPEGSEDTAAADKGTPAKPRTPGGSQQVSEEPVPLPSQSGAPGTPAGDHKPQLEAKYVQLIHKAATSRSLVVDLDCQELAAFTPSVYQQLIHNPSEVLLIFDEVVHKVALEVGGEDYCNDYKDMVPMVTRPYNMHTTKVIRDLDPSDMNKLVSVKGMITRTSGVIPDLRSSFFKCQKPQCGGKAEVLTNSFGHIAEPALCPVCQSKFSFALVHNRCAFIDKQLVKMQENPDNIPEGETPHSVTLFAQDNTVDQCAPGDRVTITGIYRAVPVRINPVQSVLSHMFKTHIDIIHVSRDERGQLFTLAGKKPDKPTPEDCSMGGPSTSEAGESQPSQSEAPSSAPSIDHTQPSTQTLFLDAALTEEDLKKKEAEFQALAQDPNLYEKLTNSVAPNIFGMEELKRGILCQLFGGMSKSFPGGRIRGDINVLLVGDPGVSKSQLLSWTHKTAPRGIYTSGRGSSAVGLTAYVSKDPETREMVLESGALVLSDKGICCIDEFDKMSDNARSMLHEVMEQQTVSVAKAGLISVLNARTSVLASANPIGSRFDDSKNLVENINLPPTLLSRFDLIFKVLDVVDRERDKRLARHLVAMYYPKAAQQPMQDIISQQAVREYVAYARAKIHPEISPQAGQELANCYTRLRKTSGDADIVGVTPRQLESLIRLSEAQAKMRLSKTVTVEHVKEAHRLWWAAMTSAAQQQNGRIDFNLITTGMTADEAEQMNTLAEPLEEIMKQDAQRGKLQWNLIELAEELVRRQHPRPSERTLANVVMGMSHLVRYDVGSKRVSMR